MMTMTLDKAINDYEKMAKHQDDTAKYNIEHGGTEYAKMAKTNKKKSAEYRQMAEWLKELKMYRAEFPSRSFERYDSIEEREDDDLK